MRYLLPLLLSFLSAASVRAAGADASPASDNKAGQLTAAEADYSDTLLDRGGRSLVGSHFTWGADVGSSVDLSGSDMTTFDVDAYFGYKGSYIRTAAAGVGLHKAFGNSYTFVPVYALLRTSFRSAPSLFFFEVKGGYSFNTLAGSGSAGGAYGSIGVGINLAMSRKLQSHIVFSYGFYTLRHASELAIPYVGDNISYAVLHFGVNF